MKTSNELHYIAGLCELAANGIGSGVDWEQVSKDLRGFAAQAEFTDHLDAIIADLTPNERTEFSGYVYEGRAETIESLKAKGLLFSLDRCTPLGGAVSHRLSWLASREPARTEASVSEVSQ